MKLKHLLTTLALTCFANGGGNLMAQTDVTSTYINNPSFEDDDAATSNVANSKAGNYSDITSWTKVTTGNNSDNSYSAIAIAKYGSNITVNGATVPSEAPTPSSGYNALGISMAWVGRCVYQQEVTLPAGSYKLSWRFYNAVNNTPFTSQFGFITDGASYLSNKTSYASLQWGEEEVQFILNESTTGKIQIGGYQGGSSNNNAKIFFDDVTLIYTSFDVAPDLEKKTNFGGTAYISSNFYPQTDEDFTLEMDGTAGTAITLNGLTATYTPSINGKVRFVRVNGNVYVYENQEFKQRLDTSDPFPVIDASNVASSVDNMLLNSDFATTGDNVASNNARKKLGTPWVVNDGLPYGDYGIRINVGETNATSGGNVLVWRGTGNDNWFAQPVSNITANTLYKVQVYQYTGANAGALFNIGLGANAGEYDIASAQERLGAPKNGTPVNGLHSVYFETPSDMNSSDLYFTFRNTNPSTTDYGDQGDALTQIDWLSMSTADVSISGGSNMVYLAGTAYAPAQLEDEKSYLLAAINEAKLLDVTTNVGNGLFQKPKSAADAFTAAYNVTAQGVYDDESATLEEVVQAIEDLAVATEAWENAALNPPVSGKNYVLTLQQDGFNKSGNSVEFVKGGQTEAQGLYALQYNRVYNPALRIQNFKFNAVVGEVNLYTISFLDVDGETRYICDGTVTGAGTGAYGIRTTTDAEKALPVRAIASEMEGITYLWNTKANQYLGSNGDAGLYTDSKYTHFIISESAEASVAVQADVDKFATRIFPFAPGAIDGITFYTATVNGEKVELEEVETPEANKPYILKASKNVETSVSGWGTATADSYTEGALTGVYTAATIDADANNYVLQTQGGIQAFYKVDEAFTATAYRAYLTAEAAGEVKALYFDFGGETAIKGVEAADMQNATIYNLAGQRVNKAQKGIYVVNGKKVAVK